MLIARCNWMAIVSYSSGLQRQSSRVAFAVRERRLMLSRVSARKNVQPTYRFMSMIPVAETRLLPNPF